jgi:hypothetical protein
MLKMQPTPESSSDVFDVFLVRIDNSTLQEVERVKVWTWEDLPEAAPLGALLSSLNYTTSYTAVANGDRFDIVRVRNDPYTEAHITPDVVVDTITAPGAEDLMQLPDILTMWYKNWTNYEAVQTV